MTEAAAPQSVGTVADEIMAQALEQNAARAAITTTGETVSETTRPAAAKPQTPGFVDPLDESLFSDEALKDPKVVQERAALLRAQVKEAQKIRSAAHNARAEAERREARFKGTKQQVLAEKSALQSQSQLVNALVADLQSGDPARFVTAIERLSGAKDGNEYWRSIATHLATGKKPEVAPTKELLELRTEIERMKARELQKLEQQDEAQIEQQLIAQRHANIATAQTYTDLPYVSSLSAENPAIIDARLCDLMQQHYQRTGQPLDLRAACDMVEVEIRSHFELLQRAGGAKGVTNGEKGAAAPVAGQAGTPERIAKPATAPSSPKQQSTPQTLPSSLVAEPGATKRSLSEAEQRDATIEAFEKMGIFANLGM